MPDSRSWPTAIRALRHPNFRLYFAGQAISTLGSWLQQVALAWLIYRLTGSAALLGITTFAALVPQLLVGPLAGAWIDRHDKRRLLIGVQGLLGLQASGLALLTVTGNIGPVLIVAMAALLGVLNAFDTPLRQSLLSQFVSGKQDLPNALALNAMLFNSSRFIGPPLAGLLLGVTSEAACFALNALSYVGLTVGLLIIRMAPTPRATGSTGDVFREGLAYVAGRPTIRLMMLSVLVVNLTASSYAVLLPVFAKDIFAGDARTLGWLWGAAGLGSLLGTLFLANRHALAGLANTIMVCAMAGGASLLAFALSEHLLISLLAMALLGFAITNCNVGTNILLQSLAPEHLRGRVVSLYTSTRFGFDAIGCLLVGVLAEHLGAPWAMAVAGILLLGYCVWLSPRQRQLGREIANVKEDS
ncbi:MFS transporter [Pseudomonas sp. BN414]|uniref:MFS transporter n=1 Tax=Pseudomonas sp. BN414 TaxID=2567888 RepID=UPI00245630FF|nr:MFS transporter [Pseudomonas sp. BN414]MDH4568018.1 MFS transporter [Pseudomonas sp. BN414]